MTRLFFEVLLRAYPESFRHRHAPDMWLTFEANHREARKAGCYSVATLWLREIHAAVRALRRSKADSRLPRLALGSPGREMALAVRALAKSPGFTLMVFATLALGVGANTAIFSVVNGVLLRPLPYPEDERLVTLIGRFVPESGYDFPEFSLSEPEVLDVRETMATLRTAGFVDFDATVTGGDEEPERIRAARVSADFSSILRIEPVLGRWFGDEEDAPPGAEVVVIGRGLWQRRFGGDPTVLGRTIGVNGTTQQIVGVAPAGIFFASPDVELYAPLGLDTEQDRSERGGHYLRTVGRVVPGASLEEVEAELSVLMNRWREDYPDAHTGHFLFMRPLKSQIVGDVRPALVVLMAAVGALLFVACANVGNLFLARSEERHREIALKTALGAGSARIIQHYLTESLLLCTLGGLAGTGLAAAGIELLLSIDSDVLPAGRDVTIDSVVLAYSLAVTLGASLAFGVLPPLSFREKSLHNVLRDAGARSSSTRRGVGMRQMLVVAEVASSLVLLLTASLLVKSLGKLLSEDPGFRASRILVARVALPSARYQDARLATAFFGRLLARARALPGVLGAASASDLPLSNSAPNNDVRIEGRPEPAPGEAVPAGSMVVSSVGYFRLLNIPLVRGRLFAPSDRIDGLPVAVISRSMAETFWPHQDPIGQRINPLFGEEPLLTIVGIVEDVKYEGLGDEARAAWYFPIEQSPPIAPWTSRSQRILLRVSGDPMAQVAPLRALVRQLDPELVVSNIRTMDDVVSESVARERFTTMLLSVFALVTVMLGASGIFAVVSYSVSLRRKELGIRAALGATRAMLVAMVAGQGLRLCLVGLAIGLAIALVTTSRLETLLHRVSPNDPQTFVAVLLGVTFVALLASFLPAYRASGIDPIATLRSE